MLLDDVVMRGLSGPELVRQLTSSRPTMKIVFMSGYTGELLGGHDIFQQGTRFLEKPFTRATLLQTLESSRETGVEPSRSKSQRLVMEITQKLCQIPQLSAEVSVVGRSEI